MESTWFLSPASDLYTPTWIGVRVLLALIGTTPVGTFHSGCPSNIKWCGTSHCHPRCSSISTTLTCLLPCRKTTTTVSAFSSASAGGLNPTEALPGTLRFNSLMKRSLRRAISCKIAAHRSVDDHAALAERQRSPTFNNSCNKSV